MRHRALSIIAASNLVGLLFIACNDTDPAKTVALVGPTSATLMTVAIQPVSISIIPVVGAVCPFQSPFTSAFNVVVQDRSAMALSLDRVTFHFLDGSNISSSPISFSRNQLVGLFPSSMTIPPQTSSAFQFALKFGCGIGTPQVVIGDLVLLDPFGITHNATVRATIF
jgi:hypothetical protein